MMSGTWPPVIEPPAPTTSGSVFFAAPLAIVRRAPGSYVNGLWQEGAETALTISANVQPPTLADYSSYKADTDGSRVGEMIRLYTAYALIVSDPHNDTTSTGQSGDIVVWDAENPAPTARWLVVKRSRWASGILSNNRYLAVRLPEV